ncbi:MAG: rhombosortase [Parahaliea sp.]
MRHFPLLTLTGCVLAVLLMCLPENVHPYLYFDYAGVLSGQYWRLLSGHWLHIDSGHLWLNITAFAVLGTLIETHNRTLLLIALLAGMLAVNLLLLSPCADIARYCGLSGLLNTLFVVVLGLRWRVQPSALLVLAGLGSFAKIFLELYDGSILSDGAGWPAWPSAHLAGALAALLLLALCRHHPKLRKLF